MSTKPGATTKDVESAAKKAIRSLGGEAPFVIIAESRGIIHGLKTSENVILAKIFNLTGLVH